MYTKEQILKAIQINNLMTSEEIDVFIKTLESLLVKKDKPKYNIIVEDPAEDSLCISCQ